MWVYPHSSFFTFHNSVTCCVLSSFAFFYLKVSGYTDTYTHTCGLEWSLKETQKWADVLGFGRIPRYTGLVTRQGGDWEGEEVSVMAAY